MTYENVAQAYAEAMIEDGIRTEILNGIEQAGSVRGHINNFTENLSGGTYRPLIESLGWMDRGMADPRHEPGSDQDPHSVRGREVTWAQFFADIDQAVAESGIDTAELARLQALEAEPSLDRERWQDQEALARFALPVYRQLRILGYSRFELRR